MIASMVNIAKETVLRNKLNMKQVCAQMVPKNLIQD